jgi:SAM-dependent methyltransferase
MIAVHDLKRTHRATWAAGDYAAVAEHIDDVPPRDLLARAELEPGLDVLDVATGTGNIALRAAAQGASVVGLDLTPELFATARRRAGRLGVTVDWIEGDAERLPFAAGSFDRVLSAFGVQFVPRHQLVADELVRVLRPGGLIALVNWTPEGLIGELFRIMGAYLPAPPDYAAPPPLWGHEDHVRDLFAGAGLELAFARGHNPWHFDSPEHWVAFMETRYGPTVKARERLTAERRWADCRAELLALAERHNRATRGRLHMEAEYLVAVARRAIPDRRVIPARGAKPAQPARGGPRVCPDRRARAGSAAGRITPRGIRSGRRITRPGASTVRLARGRSGAVSRRAVAT